MDIFYPPVRFTLRLGMPLRNKYILSVIDVFCETAILGVFFPFKLRSIACIIQCYCPAVADTLAFPKVSVIENREQFWVSVLTPLYTHFAVNFSSTHQLTDDVDLQYQSPDFSRSFKFRTYQPDHHFQADLLLKKCFYY